MRVDPSGKLTYWQYETRYLKCFGSCMLNIENQIMGIIAATVYHWASLIVPKSAAGFIAKEEALSDVSVSRILSIITRGAASNTTNPALKALYNRLHQALFGLAEKVKAPYRAELNRLISELGMAKNKATRELAQKNCIERLATKTFAIIELVLEIICIIECYCEA
jgi:hypothetical protein